MNDNKDLLISLFSQSLDQINTILPEANIRDLLAIAKESLAMYSKVCELEAELPDSVPIATNNLIQQLQRELNNV